MRKAVRWINGQEYLMCGRASSKDEAKKEAKALLKSWSKVVIVKYDDYDFAIFVHGSK